MSPSNERSLTRLDEACEIILGQSPPGESYNTKGEGLPFFQGKAEFQDLYPKAVKWCTQPSKIAEQDDVLISVRAPVGPTNLCPERACIGRGLAALRPHDGIPSRYVLYAIRSNVQSLAEQATGSTFEAINGSQLRAHRIPLAPSGERERIVAEIEKQFTRLDVGVASLKRVQIAMKRYRASVLKTACEGRLVPTEAELARKENRSYETGEQLLQRILKKRREKWNGKGKYKEPATPTIVDLPSLREGWTWASLDQLMLNITDGDHQPPPQTNSGVPFLVIRDVKSGKLDFGDTRFVSREYANQVEPFRKPARGDILYTLVGSYGIALRVTTDQEFCIQRHIGVLRPHETSPADYLTHVLNSSFVFRQASKVATGTAQMTVPLAGLRRIAIPLPPVAEQQRIVAEVDHRLSVIEELEVITSTELRRATRLRQSILQQAFNGEL
jgi:type I restriction enzyme, S subunit